MRPVRGVSEKWESLSMYFLDPFFGNYGRMVLCVEKLEATAPGSEELAAIVERLEEINRGMKTLERMMHGKGKIQNAMSTLSPERKGLVTEREGTSR